MQKLDATRSVTQRPSRASQRGLDWFTFLVADVQTGFGPFIAVYLTTQKWSQADIGLVLTVGSLASLVAQIPAGALVDAARAERTVAGVAVVAIGASAILIALLPVFGVVLAAKILHSAASSVLGPAMAAISLGLVGHTGLGERLGRNARFASVGAAVAAVAMGAAGQYFGAAAVFYAATLLAVPALAALMRIEPVEIDPELAHGGGPPEQGTGSLGSGLRELAAIRPLVLLAIAVGIFHLANAAMLPLLASEVTQRASDWASTLVAACMIVPQVIVVAVSPWVGRRAVTGRRALLLLGFAALPARALLLGLVHDPRLYPLVQILDGFSAAALGILVAVAVADLTRGTGRFNLALGVVSCAMGVGASLSTVAAGVIADSMGAPAAFFTMAAAGCAGLAFAAHVLPRKENWR